MAIDNLDSGSNIISVRAQKKHGVLIKIYSRLKAAGYTVSKHTVKANADDGLEIIDFYVSGATPDDSTVLSALSDVPEFVELLSGTGVSSSGASGSANSSVASTPAHADLKTLAQTFAVQILKTYPDVTQVLDQASASVSESEQSALLRSIGTYVGSETFKEEYSLGLPMKIDPYMSRAIALTLKPLGEVTIKGKTLSLAGSSCCSPRAERSQCHFVFGLIQGLVFANRATKDVKVDRVACLTTGDPVCTFMFS